eukprot:TRINITY_DN68083_c0_g1_i10.p1 TRINITY_DN68083_c0_g1~~TRINITY_DN68083_c0_g1_i10.p1  ORF type:complete len:669 (-),score=40.50 TRINITY_DN68083_c0_g1_i10:101-2107(-)
MGLSSQKGQRLVYVLVDCVWNCVITHAPSECRFLDLQGVHCLLDVLEKGPPWLQLCVLSCLADFFESNQLAVKQALRWVSRSTHRQVQKLLISVWMKQAIRKDDPYQVKMEAERLATECPTPENVPFQPKEKKYTNVVSAKHVNPKQTFKAVSSTQHTLTDPDVHPLIAVVNQADIQTKVYCVLKQTGFEAHESLTFDERSTLVDISALVDTRNDTMWEYVEDTLREEGIRPVSADQAKLDETRKTRAQRLQNIKQQQGQVDQSKAQWETQDEITFYKSLIKKSEDPAVVAKAEPSKGLTITQAKMRKTAMLKASFQSALEQSTKTIPAIDPSTNKDPLDGDPFKETAAAVRAAKRNPQKREAPHSAPAGTCSSPTNGMGVGPKPPTQAFIAPVPPAADTSIHSQRRSTLSFTVADNSLASGWPDEVDLSTIPPTLPKHVRAFADQAPAGQGHNETQKFLTIMEYNVLCSLNNFRRNPASLLPTLENLKHRQMRQAEIDGVRSVQEVKQAFEVASDFIRKAVNSNDKPKAIKQCPIGMVLAARDHALDTGGKGLTGHTGSDAGSLQSRLNRYGSYDAVRPVCECIGYGYVEADEIVASMLVDDPEMFPEIVGQRNELLNSEYRYCGIGLHWHRVHKAVAVLIFACSFRERPRQQQDDAHARFKAMFCE